MNNNMTEADAFLEKYDINRSIRGLISDINWLNITNNSKEYLETRLPEISEKFNKAIDDLQKLRIELISKWATESGLSFSIEVSEYEWFYYADAKETPMCIIKDKAFRYVNGKLVNQQLTDGWIVSKTVDGLKYIVSHKILPLSKMSKE